MIFKNISLSIACPYVLHCASCSPQSTTTPTPPTERCRCHDVSRGELYPVARSGNYVYDGVVVQVPVGQAYRSGSSSSSFCLD